MPMPGPRRCFRAVEWRENGRWECRTCGRPLALQPGGAPVRPIRHRGDHRSVAVTPEPADAPVFGLALDLARQAVTELPAAATDDERARAVVEAVYAAGLLRRRVPAKTA